MQSLFDGRQNAPDRGEERCFDRGKIRSRPVPVHNKAERHRQLFFVGLNDDLPSEALGVQRESQSRSELATFCIGNCVRRDGRGICTEPD
jgi:hypothetical protein